MLPLSTRHFFTLENGDMEGLPMPAGIEESFGNIAIELLKSVGMISEANLPKLLDLYASAAPYS